MLQSVAYRVMPATLGFDLNHLNHDHHVVEQHDRVSKLFPFFLPARIPVNEISEERAFQKPLTPFFFVGSALSSDFGNFAHPKAQLRKCVEIKHLCFSVRTGMMMHSELTFSVELLSWYLLHVVETRIRYPSEAFPSKPSGALLVCLDVFQKPTYFESRSRGVYAFCLLETTPHR